jgi:acyl-coenzyme A thioesterase PaaI-like protein
MTVNFLRPGQGERFVAEGRVHKVTTTSAFLGADLFDERGRRIASASVVSHLITDLSRLTSPGAVAR